jgi:hypothetical protein
VVTLKAGQTTPYAKLGDHGWQREDAADEIKYFNAAGTNVEDRDPQRLAPAKATSGRPSGVRDGRQIPRAARQRR